MQTLVLIAAADYPNVGGCRKTIHAANADWSEVIEVTITSPRALVPGEAQVLKVGDGVIVRQVSGSQMANLYCNDTLEGGGRKDETLIAFHGTVTVTIGAPYPDELGGWSDGADVVVALEEILFDDDGDQMVVYDFNAEAKIGWIAG